MKQQRINITVAGKTFRLDVTSPENEEKLRKAAAEINGKLDAYQKKHPGQGFDVLLPWIAVMSEFEKLSAKEKAERLERESAQLSREIESYLENDKMSR